MNPREVQGTWRRGWTLDVHTTSSEFLGYDQNGHPQFDTQRSELGELVYQLKYRGQRNANQIAKIMADFFTNKPNTLASIEIIIPMPPSSTRNVQPVALIAASLARKLHKCFSPEVIRKIRETSALKEIFDQEQRRELLDGAFEVDRTKINGKGVLLIDDLYRSGATANAVTFALMKAGASRVYFLAVTRTRSNA